MSLENELKQLIIDELKLEDFTVDDIKNNETLFGEGLGLDSLDAVELVVILKKHYKIDLEDMEKAREAFASIDSLAAYIREHSEVK